MCTREFIDIGRYYLECDSHVGEVSPGLVSPVGVVDEGRAEGDGAGPGDGLHGGEDGVQVQPQLRQGQAQHHQGGLQSG